MCTEVEMYEYLSVALEGGKFCCCLQRFAGSIGNKVEERGEVEHWCVYRSGNVRVPLSCLRRRKIISDCCK